MYQLAERKSGLRVLSKSKQRTPASAKCGFVQIKKLQLFRCVYWNGLFSRLAMNLRRFLTRIGDVTNYGLQLFSRGWQSSHSTERKMIFMLEKCKS